MPTKPEIEAAHAAGDTQSFDRWACDIAEVGFGHVYPGEGDSIRKSRIIWRCQHCGFSSKDDHVSQVPHCNRFTTDLTSVVEFEKACMPDRYHRIIEGDAITIYYRGGDTFLAPNRKFASQSLVVNWCAAVIWAIEDERERNL